MEAASTSETSVNFYQTTRRNNPEDSHLQHFSTTKINWLKLLKDIIPVYTENHTKSANKNCSVIDY
jgi:hypothetical protein